MRDFCPGGRLVRVRSRRMYLCHKPTVAAVLAALERFAPEVLVLMQLHAAGEITTAEVVRRGIAALSARPLDAAEVLALCVEAPGLDRAGVMTRLSVRPRDVALVAASVLSQADLARIWKSLDLSRPAEEREDRKGGGVAALCRILGVDPVAVSAWPYEALLEASDDLKATAEGEDAEEAVEGASAPGVAIIGGAGRVQ